MTSADADSTRLREERAELLDRRAKLSESIERVQHVGSAADGEEYVEAREEKALIQTRLDEIDEILAGNRRS